MSHLHAIATALKQWACRHAVCWTDVARVSPNLVRCPCRRCWKVLEAPYGIALDARWVAPTHADLDRLYSRAAAAHQPGAGAAGPSRQVAGTGNSIRPLGLLRGSPKGVVR